MAKNKPNKRSSNPNRKEARRRRIRRWQNKEAARKCIFDKAVHPTTSSKKIRACSIVSKVSFKEMEREEQDKVSMHPTVNYRFQSFPNDPSF